MIFPLGTVNQAQTPAVQEKRGKGEVGYLRGVNAAEETQVLLLIMIDM